MRTNLVVLALVLLMCGCRKGSSLAERGALARPAAAPVTGPAQTQIQTQIQTQSQPQSQPQTQLQPGFDVAVRLSPKARAELLAKAETVIVYAALQGGPKPGTPAEYVGDDGQVIGLGDRQVEVAPGARARFDHLQANMEALAHVNGTPGVLINVYSGRKSSKDNLLDCGIYDGPLSTIADSVVPIDCKLIAE